MRYLTPLFLSLGAWAFAMHANAGTAAVVRDGWSYDRASFREPAAKVGETKAAKKGLKLTGWAEYDVTVLASGWYELWLGGCPPEWPRDVYLDGEAISRLQVSFGADKLAAPNPRGVQFKELNLFLSAGKHTLRFQRLGAPGVLPEAWELRPSDGAAASCIRLASASDRIGEPGASTAVKILGGGTGAATGYDLFWRDEATGVDISAGRVDFEAGDAPVEKSVALTLPKAGLYSLQAKSGGVWLRPSDLKAGYFLSAERRRVASDAANAPAFRFGAPFRDGAVLQREKPLPVWGWAKPGASVTVTLAKQTEKAVADGEGRWKVTFAPLAADGASLELKAIASGGGAIACHDVLIGEVWLLSGQSNMGGPLLTSTGGRALAETANYPDVRLAVTREGQAEKEGAPRPLSPMVWGKAVAAGNAQKNFAVWNAIPFAFGTEVSDALRVPVGLISANRGGTFVSTWISRELHEQTPSLRAIADSVREDERERVSQLVHLNKLAGQLRKWRADCDKAAAAGGPAPVAPVLTAEIQTANAPGLNYANLIEPLGDFPIRGVLWYQGESDSNMAEAYAERFPLLIKSWRELWRDPALPFLYAQIAYGSGNLYTGQPGDCRGAELKSVQLQALALPNTAMVVTDDLMKPGDDVHYPDKLPVGHRLALAALATVYGREVDYSGPIYKTQRIEDGKIRLAFDFAKGLAARGDPGAQLGGFTVAGEDRRWVKADAVIDGETVVVSSAQVSKPVAVRYSWADQPSGGNLVNRSGLPSPVFRTDNWPLSTAGVLWEKKN